MFLKSVLAVFANKSGATAIEYALIAALVSIAFIIALVSTGSSIEQMLVHVANVLSDVAEETSS